MLFRPTEVVFRLTETNVFVTIHRPLLAIIRLQSLFGFSRHPSKYQWNLMPTTTQSNKQQLKLEIKLNFIHSIVRPYFKRTRRKTKPKCYRDILQSANFQICINCYWRKSSRPLINRQSLWSVNVVKKICQV